jgi:predicted Zn-dependent protease
MLLRRERRRSVVLAVALTTELLAGTIFVLGSGSGAPRRPLGGAAQRPNASRTGAAGEGRSVWREETPRVPAPPDHGFVQLQVSSPAPSVSTVPAGVASAPGSSTPGRTVPGGTVPGSTVPTTAPPAPPAPPPVICETDLSLAQSPDVPYNFMCRQGGVPLTWSTSQIVIYKSGLTEVQNAAFAVAVAQWEVDGHFQVTYTSVPGAANVTVTDTPLSSSQPGYTEDGYAMVFYRCATTCAYDRAQVQLSSSATLLQTDWVSTILHELGHVAGLNHVSQMDEVMYPVITATSPAVYESGDRAGLAILASERGA